MSAATQKGMAVIGALLVVAATSVATAAILERQNLLADTLIGERDRVQARWLLRGGVDWARVILQNDARHNAVTLRSAIWAQPIAGLEVRTPDGSRSALFSGLVEDEQGKFNLTRLAVGGEVRAAELAALERLLNSLGLPTSIAPAIAVRVAQTQAGPGRAPVAVGLRSVEDLVALDGIDRRTVAILAEYLTVLPQSTPLNLNTASAEVLSVAVPGLELATARQLVEERERGHWFTSRGDFLNRLGDAVTEGTRQALLDVRSDWFKVSGDVRLEHAQVGMAALLNRQGNAPPNLIWMRG
ncbi:MAG TPA: type II secretion system minor pseudopilin GspK [Burkholderiaceae bacterium]|nr:type II secretion system minor pseudopilin GspK [Burkholderiaceae bacterium]